MGPGRRRPGNTSVARLDRPKANARFTAFTEGQAMRHLTLSRAASTILALLFLLSPVVARAQLASSYSQDDQLASEPAPWTVPGKWGPRGNWGRWGEQDKRGMLNFLTPDLIVKAAGLVKQGKGYALGEERPSHLPRAIPPSRFGVQIIHENDGYDRVTQAGQFDPKRNQGAASFTIIHNHGGTHPHPFPP